MRSANLSDRIIAQALEVVGGAPQATAPFPHLRLAGFFPADVYEAMCESMPRAAAYRPMSGRAREARREDGTPTRTKLHLLPECMGGLPPPHRELWSAVGTALRSRALRDAFVERLGAGLEQRFGPRYRSVGLYAIPILTRDIPGYRIGIHPDTRHKGITVQLYLPRDESIRHVGTVFHRRLDDTHYEPVCQVPFLPNSGYGFAVGSDTYHSLDEVGAEVRTRDSILLTYFLDDTRWQRITNRAKRAGNFVAAEARRILPRTGRSW